MRTFLLVAGSLLPLAASATYTVSILRGQTRPQRMTRFLMLVVTALTTAALWTNHDGSGFWLALASFLESLFILVLTFGKRGIGGRDRLDIICLVLCVLGCVLWSLSGESMIGLLAFIAVDIVACTPALVKTVKLPHTESLWFYLMGMLAGLCVFLAGEMIWQAALFPLYITVMDGAFVVVIALGRKRRSGLGGVPATPMG